MIKYYFLDALRERSFIFWNLLFPILLSSLFYMAFSSLIEPESFSLTIGLENDNPHTVYYQAIDVLTTNLTDSNKGQQNVLNGKYSAYIDAENTVFSLNNDAATRLIKSIADQMEQITALGQNAVHIDFNKNYIQNTKTDNAIKGYYAPYYALIAMNALYSAFGILESVRINQANLSATGIRLESSPKTKFNMLFSNIIISVVLNITFNLVLIFYTTKILGIALFPSLLHSLIIIFILNLCGACLGLILSVTNTLSYNQKNGFIIIATLFMSFLSGMMNIATRVTIAKQLPIVQKINPIALATDTFYQINQYNDYTYYVQNTILILAISCAMFMVSIFRLRRKKYDHI